MARDGLLLVLFASLWFSTATMLVKVIGPDVPAVWVSFMRCLVSIPFVAAVMRQQRVSFTVLNPLRMTLRGLFGVLAMLSLFWSLPRMPLADNMLLTHCQPIYAALWGVLFFGERLDKTAVLCVAIAFLGVFITLRPELTFDSLPYFAALASGFFSSLAYATIKSLSRTEPPLRIIFYFGVIGSIAFLPFLFRTGFVPSWNQAGLMCGVAMAATVGQVFLTTGISRTPVSRASMGALFVIVLNIIGGMIFFGEIPDLMTWLGCLLITGGILGLTNELRRRLLLTLAD